MMSIKNGDLPAMPLYDMPLDSRSAANWLTGGLCGLTKREQFAMAAMQGIVSNMLMRPDDVAEKAVKYTDALLAELERTK